MRHRVNKRFEQILIWNGCHQIFNNTKMTIGVSLTYNQFKIKICTTIFLQNFLKKVIFMYDITIYIHDSPQY